MSQHTTQAPLTNIQLRAAPPAIYSYPVELQVERTGLFLGQAARVVYILGRRSLGWNSTSVLGDVAQYLNTTQDLINAVSTGTTYYLNSTSANDTAAGTGARTVRIVYLDSSGNQQVRTDTLNGTTPVSIGSGYSYFQWAEVASVGSGGVSAGNITISSTNGAATTATTVEYIAAGGNRSLSARYKVPTGYTAYITNWDVNAINGDMDARLRAKVFADDRALSTVHHFQDNLYQAANTRGEQRLDYLPVPAGAEIKISAIPSASAAGNRCDASFRLILVSN